LKLKLVSLLIFILITAGCEQAFRNNHADISGLHTQSDSKLKSSESDQGTSTTANSRNDSKLSEYGNNSISDKTKELNDSSLDIGEKYGNNAIVSYQEKIEQALELCNIAQLMWKNNKIDEALSTLDSAYLLIIEIDSESVPDIYQQKEDVRILISKRILEIYASRRTATNGQFNEIPLVLNEYVEKEIKRFTGRDKRFFISSLERSSKFRHYILAELKKAGLPEELSWLPLIESGFKLRALSPARALGLWQFIPSTGYKFGLNRNRYIDERLDFEKSTQAAISYLKELHDLFGDWITAMAAYNCGEGRVLRVIRQQRINYLDNFWDLYQRLPRETARYVPKFLATLHIINNPEKYGMPKVSPPKPMEYATCKISNQVHLRDIARTISVDVKILKELNPELRYAVVPDKPYKLRIPKEKANLFMAKANTIKSTYTPVPEISWHRVRRNETLSTIARRYKTSVKAIMAANNIRNRHLIRAGKALKIPVMGYASGSKKRYQSGQRKIADAPYKYKVKHGDNLWTIAGRYGTTVKKIMAINKLRSTTLTVGQTLIINPNKLVSSSIQTRHRVRKGDSPSSIAKKYNISLKQLLTLNQLNRNSTIFPGQSLIIK
jgi:membrane-bound lytic murein transglycosylase D